MAEDGKLEAGAAGAGTDAGKTGTQTGAAGTAGKADAAGKEAAKQPATGDAGKQGNTASLASGTDDDGKEGAATWPDDWRQRVAGEDKAALKTLERLKSPADLYAKVKNLEKKLSEKAGPKPKPEDAEELKAWRAEHGVPEKPEGYIETLKLSNNKVLGEIDKPIASSFATAMHAIDAPPAIVNAGIDWYYKHQEEIASAQFEEDKAFQVKNRDLLRDELGAEFKTRVNSIPLAFSDAPGGVDFKNEESLAFRVMNARLVDGRRLGDDADAVKWLMSMAEAVNPGEATLAGKYGGKAPGDRLEEISKLRREKPHEYEQNRNKLEAEEIELMDARLRMQKRGKAA